MKSRSKGQAMTRKQALVQAIISGTAMIGSGVMLSEFWADILYGRNNMPVPKWMKPLLWLALAVLVGIEGTKVREDFESFWSPEEDD